MDPKKLEFPQEFHTVRRKRLEPWCQTDRKLVYRKKFHTVLTANLPVYLAGKTGAQTITDK